MGYISDTAYYLEEAECDARSFRRRLRKLHRYVRPPGSLFDIGAGVGTFVRVATEAGWHATGIEANKESAREAWKQGLPVRNIAFPCERPLALHLVNAITMNDFIEHLERPLEALTAARGLLYAGGILMLSTPDVGSWLARLTGQRWLHYKPGEHLFYYDRATMRTHLNDAGFDVLFMRTAVRSHSLGVAMRKARVYIPRLSAFACKWAPAWFKALSLPLALGDEMLVIARAR